MIVPVHESAAAAGAMGGRVGVGIRGAGRGRLSFAAPYRAEDEAAPGQERPSEQRRPASVAAETAGRGVPVLALVRHLTCISHYVGERLESAFRIALFNESSLHDSGRVRNGMPSK